MASYTESVQVFLDASPWISPEDAPAVVMLEALAEQIDAGDTKPATISQFGLAYRSLLKRKPKETSDEKSELDQLLDGEV